MRMVEKPVLVILAAGIGMRYGGLKQIEPVGENGELIIDYSIYDAIKAGFEKVVFIITKAIRDDFMEVIGDRISRYIATDYAYQDLNYLPKGYVLPEGRIKPWGTAQALLTIKPIVNGPFAVINADDFYGASAYRVIYDWLSHSRGNDGKKHFAMVGYRIENTVSDHGSVTRGICEAKAGYLTSIVERTFIEKHGTGARFSEDDGVTWSEIPAGTLVSMNFWGFAEGIMDELTEMFPGFLRGILRENPLKGEFFLPLAVEKLIDDGKADFRVIMSEDKWHGVTYKDDRKAVAAAVQFLKDEGIYPESLWD